MYEVFEALLKKHNVKASDVAKATGLYQTLFSEWKKGKSTPKADKLQKIADYFGVSVEYLMTGKEKSDESELTKRDERDIAKDLDYIMDLLDSGDDGPIRYNGQPIDENSRTLLRNALELGLTQLKVENKELYNPNKNKK